MEWPLVDLYYDSFVNDVEGQTEMVELLLRWGCDLGTREHNMTALHWAAERGHSTCVQRLLQAGINPNCQIKHTYQGKLKISNLFSVAW